MKYYNEREGLLSSNDLHIDLNSLKAYWFDVYQYCKNCGYLDLAENGLEHGKIKLPLKMSPSPELYLLKHIQKEMYPISPENLKDCSEGDMFTLIEIFYRHVELCEWREDEYGEFRWCLESEDVQEEYRAHVNSILRFYKEGFYLVKGCGFVMTSPNEALKKQLETKDQGIPDGIYGTLSEASKNYYRFDANLEAKKKAIASLADILEAIRPDLKKLFDAETDWSKANDKCIFDIVNNFNIRHNNSKQITDYSKEIWYDWMMQYYTSVIIAFYRLREGK